MNEITPHSPATVDRTSDGDNRVSMDRTSGPRHEETPLPTPPASSVPAAAQDSPRTAFDSSELRERVDGVLQSDVGIETMLSV
jgi:hypothetical protein